MPQISQNPSRCLKPSLGPLYQHFTKDEVEWLAQDMKLASRARREFLASAQRLKSKYPVLQWFEPQISELYPEPQNADRILVCLANYGRIRLPLGLVVRGFKCIGGNWPEDEDALVNRTQMDEIFMHTVDMGRSAESSGIRVQQTLSKLLLWSGERLEVAVNRLDEFERDLLAHYEARPPKTINCIRSWIRSLRTILAHKGYNVVIAEEIPGDLSIWGRGGQPTKHESINLAMELWGEHIKASSPYRTIQTKLSHARIFVHWLEEDFPEVETFTDLERDHIRAYLAYLDEYEKADGENLKRETINHRIELLSQWFDWIRKHHPDMITSRKLITSLDIVAESKPWPERISRSEAILLFKVLGNMNEAKWFAEKMALILMILTGLRVNSVVTLSYDCLKDTIQGLQLKVHKRKADNNEVLLLLNQAGVDCVRRAQTAFAAYAAPIYSPFDGRTIRRLLIGAMGTSILTSKNIRVAFMEAQIEAGLVGKDGQPRFTPHDLRRIFASALLAQGARPDEIAALMIQKSVSSLFPYEVNNTKAAEVFRKLEESKSLVSIPDAAPCHKQDAEQVVNEIMNLLLDFDIRQKQVNNMLQKMHNPDSAFPLIYGTCVCGSEFECNKDDLACLGCENYTVNIKRLADIERYLKGVFIERWRKKKQGIEMPWIKNRMEKIALRLYVAQLGMTEHGARQHLAELEKSVLPRRGRPTGRGGKGGHSETTSLIK